MAIPRVRARTAAATSGRLSSVTFSVAALALVLVLALSACRSSSPPWTDREALETYLEKSRGVPLVLPSTLPAPYVFLGPGFTQGEDGRAVVRTSDFRLDDGPGSMVVDVCAAEPGSPADVCVPPGTEADAVGRTVGAYPVWIRPLGTGALPAGPRDFWTTVPLTVDLDAVDWLT